MSFASFGVLSCCLIMIGCSTLFVLNINEAFKSVESQNVMKAYIKSEATQQDIDALAIRFKEMDNIENSVFVSSDEALKSFTESNDDYAKAFESLVYDNPLPASFELTIKDLTKYQTTYNEVSGISLVEKVSSQYDLAQKLIGMRRMIAIISLWIVGLLALVSLFIISNMVRVTMHSRRLEISIMKSVGATDSFIVFPFMVEGILIGLFSAAASFFAIWYIYYNAGGVLMDTLGTQVIPFERLMVPIAVLFAVIGMIAGGIGSRMSIRKYLRSGGGSVYDAI